MFVKPPGPRHTATEEGDGLVIRIPAKRNVLIFTAITLWLCVWSIGEIVGVINLFSAAQMEARAAAFSLLWFCVWTGVGAFAIHDWLWLVKGYEVITISPNALTIKRELFGYGRTKHYAVTEIRQLRISPFTFNPFDLRSNLTFRGIGDVTLTFDYGYKTFRFGMDVDEAEARVILKAITNRVPRLADANSI